MEGAGQPLARAGETEPPEDAGQAHVHRHQAQPALDRSQLDVVDADDLAVLDVDDLLVEQVEPEPNLIRALPEAGDVDARRLQPRSAGVDLLDVGPRQEDVTATGNPDHEPGDRWVPIAERHDQVAHLAKGLAVPVEHRTADQSAQEEHEMTTSLPRRIRRDARGWPRLVGEGSGRRVRR